MNIKVLAAAIMFTLVGSSLGARSFQNVPTVSHKIEIESPYGEAEVEKAMNACKDQTEDSRRMLVRKGVDIILEIQDCEVREGLVQSAIYFMN